MRRPVGHCSRPALCLGRRVGGRRRGRPESRRQRLGGHCRGGRQGELPWGARVPPAPPALRLRGQCERASPGAESGRGVRGWRSGCLIPSWAADGRCSGKGFPSRWIPPSLAGVNWEGPPGRGAGPRQESLLAKVNGLQELQRRTPACKGQMNNHCSA